MTPGKPVPALCGGGDRTSEPPAPLVRGLDQRGHQVVGSYHVVDPLTINLRYMRTEKISNAPGTKAEQDRLFFDLVWAF